MQQKNAIQNTYKLSGLSNNSKHNVYVDNEYNFNKKIFLGEVFQEKHVIDEKILENYELQLVSSKTYEMKRKNKSKNTRKNEIIDIYHNFEDEMQSCLNFSIVEALNELRKIDDILQSYRKPSKDKNMFNQNTLNRFFSKETLDQFQKVKNSNDNKELMKFSLKTYSLKKIKKHQKKISHILKAIDDKRVKVGDLQLENNDEKKEIRKKNRFLKRDFFNTEVKDFIINNLKEFREKNMSIIEMKKEVEKVYQNIRKIGRTTFFNAIKKKARLTFKQSRAKYGVLDQKKKSWSRVLTSKAILDHLSEDDSVWFFDECSFKIGNFNRKSWWKKGEFGTVNIRYPTLIWKLNMLVSKTKILTFQLSRSHHTQTDVEHFILTSIIALRSSFHKESIPYVVLDNVPKNRGKNIFRMAKNDIFVPIYITPGCPQHNLIEHVF